MKNKTILNRRKQILALILAAGMLLSTEPVQAQEAGSSSTITAATEDTNGDNSTAGVASFLKAQNKTTEEYIAAAKDLNSGYGYNVLGIANTEDNNLNIRETSSTEGKLVGKLPRYAACEVLKIDQYVLMVRKKDMFSFFEENKIIDNKTSFLSSYSSSNNTYTFTNIAPLITYCIEERKKGITAAGGDPEKEEDGKKWDAKNPDWNRVVIIPVKAVSNSNNEIVEISNSLGMESAMLKGGTNPENKLKMQIFYTTF